MWVKTWISEASIRTNGSNCWCSLTYYQCTVCGWWVGLTLEYEAVTEHVYLFTITRSNLLTTLVTVETTTDWWFASSFLPHTGEAAPVQTGRIMQYIFLDTSDSNVFLTVSLFCSWSCTFKKVTSFKLVGYWSVSCDLVVSLCRLRS